MGNKSLNFEKEILSLAKKLSLNVFSCGKLRVDASQNRIYLDRSAQILQPKVMQLLLLLCAANGKTLTKQQLSQMLWPDTQVGPDSLANTITRLRKALSDSSKQPQFIETVQRKGYRWLLKVEVAVEQEKALKINKTIKRYAIAAFLLVLLGSGYWLMQPDPEEFPFTDLSIEKTEKGMEVKVGLDAEMNAENQEKIKQEISRITGKSTEQMKITIVQDCTLEEVNNNQTQNCSLPRGIDPENKF